MEDEENLFETGQSSSQPRSTADLDDLLATNGGNPNGNTQPNPEDANQDDDPLDLGAGGDANEINAIENRIYITTTTHRKKVAKRLSLNGYQ